MTSRRIRDLRRLLEDVAAPFGATVAIERTNGDHLRGVLTIGERHACIVMSASPHSEWRQSRCVTRDAKRALRGLTEGQ